MKWTNFSWFIHTLPSNSENVVIAVILTRLFADLFILIVKSLSIRLIIYFMRKKNERQHLRPQYNTKS